MTFYFDVPFDWNENGPNENYLAKRTYSCEVIRPFTHYCLTNFTTNQDEHIYCPDRCTDGGQPYHDENCPGLHRKLEIIKKIDSKLKDKSGNLSKKFQDEIKPYMPEKDFNFLKILLNRWIKKS